MAETKVTEKKEEPKKAVTIPAKPDVVKAADDIWLFHKDYEPRLFKKGEEVPTGWQEKNSWKWYKDARNNFGWRKR